MGFVDSFNISNDKKEILKELALLEDNWIGGINSSHFIMI